MSRSFWPLALCRFVAIGLLPGLGIGCGDDPLSARGFISVILRNESSFPIFICGAGDRCGVNDARQAVALQDHLLAPSRTRDVLLEENEGALDGTWFMFNDTGTPEIAGFVSCRSKAEVEDLLKSGPEVVWNGQQLECRYWLL